MDYELISIRGKHFKVYDPDRKIVLEHPSDIEEVNVRFYASIRGEEPYLKIGVTEFIERKMRIPDQHKRADVYILAEYGKKIANALSKKIENNCFNNNKQPISDVTFGHPIARDGRQSVPKVTCLYKYKFSFLEAPFAKGKLTLINGRGALDLEKPGWDQTKWEAEGGSSQLHFSFFHPNNSIISEPSQDRSFYAYIPWTHMDKIRDVCQDL